jgi:excisionase family DNA binding protein
MAIRPAPDLPEPPRDLFRLMGLKEVAELLGTDWRNVREWVEAGELPCVRVGASQEPKVALVTLEAWLRRLGEAGAERSAPGNPVRPVKRRPA